MNRLYSLEEANALLPEVIPVLERLQDAYRKVRALQASLAVAARSASGDGHLLDNPWEKGGDDPLKELNQILQSTAAQLDAWGIELKDPDKCLIDFRSRRDGRTVYLCFYLGETSIAYWHELDAGFAGRQPV